jgi:galactan endo-1,6-beta-galactosidase
MDRALSTWNSYDDATRASIGKVNVHGYQGIDPYRGSNRGPLRSAVGWSKRLWVSEYGDRDYTGMWMADTIMRDLYGLRPTGWCYWQPIEPFSGWGLINADYSSGELTAVNRKFFVYGQFTRYLRPGYQIIDISDHNSVAAYDAHHKRLIIITLNFGTAQYVGYDLSAFRSIGSTFKWVATTTAPGDGIPDWTQHSEVHQINDPANKRFWSYFYPNTIQTFVINGVVR